MTIRNALRAGAVLAATSTLVLIGVPASGALTSWSPVVSPNNGANHNELHAVATAKGAPVFAVGEYFNGVADRTLVLKLSGTAISAMSTPNNGSHHNSLLGVSVASATRAWAVGTYYNGKADRTLVLQWNGASWKVQSSPNVGTKHNELDAVAAGSASNVWAVGYYFNGTADRTLVEHYNGTKWTVVTSPNVGTKHDVLSGVAVVPGSHGAKAWAVGSYFNGVNDQTLVERLSSGKWSVSKSPDVGTQGNVLSGVVATSGSVAYAVGSYTEGHLGSLTHTSQTLAERWNGTKWTVAVTDNIGTQNNEFLGVFATSSSSVYAVGRYFDGTYDQTMVQHWDGLAWHVSTSGDANTLHNELEGATAVPGGSPVAVGTYYSGTADRTLVETCKSCK